MSASALTAAQRGFILNVDHPSIEGREDRAQFLLNLAADQRRAAREQPGPPDAVPARMCRSCGYPHPEPEMSCISVLRSRLSKYE